jgi:hypothetical protein
MDELLRPREIVRASAISDIGGRPWLLIADFAEVGGRLECVGIELRSYLRCEAQVVAGVAAAKYGAYWDGPEDLAATGLNPEATNRGYRVGAEPRDLSSSDQLAVEAGAHREPELRKPRKLESQTLRALSLARELDHLRRSLVAEDADSATLRAQDNALESFLIGTGMEQARKRGDAESAEALERYEARRRQAHQAMDAGRRHPGRPRKYDQARLKEVAKLYIEAYRLGSRSPTRDVARKTGIPYGMVGKLIMRCRDEGLLKPATTRRAGGVKRTPEKMQ